MQTSFPDLEPHYDCRGILMFWDGDWEGPSIVRVLCRAKGPGPRNVLVELVYPQCNYPGRPTRWVRPARGLRRRR